MKNILRIIEYCLREAIARKLFIVLSGLSFLSLFLFALAMVAYTPSAEQGLPPDIIQKGWSPIVFVAKSMSAGIASVIFSLGIFVSIFATANLLPNFLEKGTVDLFLSKPISRTQLILGRYFGSIAIITINIAFLVFGFWMIIGLKFDYWNHAILYSIFTIAFAFASLYSMIFFLGVVFKNSIGAMILAYIIYMILSPILAQRETIFYFINNQTIKTIIDVLYYILPKTSEISGITLSLTLGDNIQSAQPIITTFIFTIIFIVSSAIVFNNKDF